VPSKAAYSRDDNKAFLDDKGKAMTVLDGPRISAMGPTTGLVVFLHGYGADGNDLIDIGREFQPYLPGVAFVAPHAPELCAMSPTGRQWFALTFRDDDERWNGAVAARPALDGFLDAERDRLGLDDDRIVLVGFSQGTMMVLHAGLRRARAPAAIIGYSGLLPGADRIEGINQKPPVTLIHGDRDQVIDVAHLAEAVAVLKSAGVPVSATVCPGLGHGIDQRGLITGLTAIASAFGIELPARR
jgi:phospholipase/carboxylesterase